LIAESFGTLPQLVPCLVVCFFAAHDFELPDKVFSFPVSPPQSGADKDFPFISWSEEGAFEPQFSTAFCFSEFAHELSD